MIIAIVAAVAQNRVIGSRGGLPWYLPEDLRRFRRLTMGKPIIMGRKTFESIGRALDGRKNIVLSSNPSFKAAGCQVVNSVQMALNAASTNGSDEILVIGGANVYRQFLPITQRLYLTLIKKDFEGDTHFPKIEWGRWRKVSEEVANEDDQAQFGYRFVQYDRLEPVEPGTVNSHL
jgi:dihydrofolate reductase